VERVSLANRRSNAENIYLLYGFTLFYPGSATISPHYLIVPGADFRSK